jgi:arylsulfatase A-like enzyme
MYLDREIGRILDLLESMRLREKTMIIYTSDNGGSPSTWAINVPLSGFKYSLAEGGIRVPFIVNWPGHIPAGTYNAMISGLDIVPTIAAAVGAPPRGDWDGKNLLPLLQRKAPDEAHHWHVWDTGREWAVREGDWKLRVNIDPEKNEQTSRTYNIRIPTGVQLYNLREDIGERVNLVDRHPDVVESLRTRYAHWRAEMK